MFRLRNSLSGSHHRRSNKPATGRRPRRWLAESLEVRRLLSVSPTQFADALPSTGLTFDVDVPAAVEQMRVHTFPTDLAGNPIASIAAGSKFRLVTEVQDIRDPAVAFPGVAAAAVDIAFNPALSSIDTLQTVQFDGFFELLRDSTLTQGRVVGSAGSARIDAPGNAPQFLFSVELTATGGGTQNFEPSYSENPNHEYLLYLRDEVIQKDEMLIEFDGATLDVMPQATVSVGNVVQVETDSDTTFHFAVELSAPLPVAATVAFNTLPITATEGVDYETASGTLVFAPGMTLATIPVTVHGDTNVEPDETFAVVLSNATNAALDAAVGVGTIVNDDTLPTVSIGDASDAEGDAGTTPLVFNVGLSAPSPAPVVVAYATGDERATSGSDYVPVSGTVTFAPGVITQQITVLVNGDTQVEPDETFRVTLSDPLGASLLAATGTGTIINDDEPHLAITGFTLINASTGEPIGPIADGDTIDLAALPTRSLNIRAETGAGGTESVRFTYDGHTRLLADNVAPYALFGDFLGHYLPGFLAAGRHTLTATPYSGNWARGDAGTSLTISFTVLPKTPWFGFFSFLGDTREPIGGLEMNLEPVILKPLVRESANPIGTDSAADSVRFADDINGGVPSMDKGTNDLLEATDAVFASDNGADSWSQLSL